MSLFGGSPFAVVVDPDSSSYEVKQFSSDMKDACIFVFSTELLDQGHILISGQVLEGWSLVCSSSELVCSRGMKLSISDPRGSTIKIDPVAAFTVFQLYGFDRLLKKPSSWSKIMGRLIFEVQSTRMNAENLQKQLEQKEQVIINAKEMVFEFIPLEDPRRKIYLGRLREREEVS